MLSGQRKHTYSTGLRNTKYDSLPPMHRPGWKSHVLIYLRSSQLRLRAQGHIFVLAKQPRERERPWACKPKMGVRGAEGGDQDAQGQRV